MRKPTKGQPGASLTVLADVLAMVDAMTRKYGDPNGDLYGQGVNDHGLRIRGKVAAMIEAARQSPTEGHEAAVAGLQGCKYCGPGVRTGLPGNACENCMGTGEDLEGSAWAWVQSRYPNDAASDLAFDADEMVDAYIAGASARHQPTTPGEQETDLDDLLKRSAEAFKTLPPAERRRMIAAQRESFVRGMTTPCEHGVLDFEQCGDCRSGQPGEQGEEGA